jgi:hypothetical protein
MKKVLSAVALVAFLTPAMAMAQSNSDASSMGPSGRTTAYSTSSGDTGQQATLPSARRSPTYSGFYNLPDGGSDAKSTNPAISGGPVTDALSPSAGSGTY